MPYYKELQNDSRASARTIKRLLVLRKQLSREIPTRTLKKTLLIATWNIREFDSTSYGERMPEAFYYIAEIIARFDIVAVQESERI